MVKKVAALADLCAAGTSAQGPWHHCVPAPNKKKKTQKWKLDQIKIGFIMSSLLQRFWKTERKLVCQPLVA